MSKKKASTLVYLIFFFTFLLAIIAFAVDVTLTYTNRQKLQSAAEITALSAAAAFNDSKNITQVAKDTFRLLKPMGLEAVDVNNPSVFDVKLNTTDPKNRKVMITVNMSSMPYFLTFFGVSNIQLRAKACAVSEFMPIKSSHGTKVAWLSSGKPYSSDIVSLAPTNFNDTAILRSLGKNISASFKSAVNTPDYSLLDAEDGKPLSLGPGGFVTIKAPAPIVDKPGYDFEVIEIGDAKEGYMVFAGLDADPERPYFTHENPGAGIRWVNVSCTALSEVPGGVVTNSKLDGSLTKVYGSSKFDLGDSSSGFTDSCYDSVYGRKITMAKYLRIIDDNEESAYYNKELMSALGEASTATAGADIDVVYILNHVKLIPPSSFN